MSAYTTYEKVRNAFAVGYWLSSAESGKLTQDGYSYTLDPDSFTDEEDFITAFIENSASFIDDYIGNGPFSANGTLESINRWLAIFDIEQYLLASDSDRVVSVTINEDKKRALNLLDKINSGDIQSPTPSSSSSSAAPALIEPDDDGVTLVIGDLEEDIWLGGAADATTIPE